MLNGLDLFSGIGGLSLALSEWIRPVAYVEIDAYCQCVLSARMREGRLASAPVWDDVRSFDGLPLRGVVDVIYGGFPCQDISVAGRGAGLAGERSGLFYEIARLVGEVGPAFVFLENVPAIRTRGADTVAGRLASLGYDARWDVLSAFDVGAPHLRHRWFLLATRSHGSAWALANADGWRLEGERVAKSGRLEGARRGIADRCGEAREQSDAADVVDAVGARPQQPWRHGAAGRTELADAGWWAAEPDVGRVAHGIPARVDRLKALGNAVVPAQAREAFRRLTGL